MKLVITIACLSAALCGSAVAGQLSDVYVIPAAAHVNGANGELWQSDVALFNPSDTPLNVDAVLVQSNGQAATVGATTTVPPRATVMLRDLVPAQAFGAVLISGNHPFAAMSRAYASTSRGTFGQGVLPAAEFIDARNPDAFLPGIGSGTASRTNIGFFAAAGSSAPMTVTVTLLRADGTTLGSRAFTVAAGTMTHVQVGASSIAAGSFDGGSARVSVTGGDGAVTAYASVVDSGTSDAVFVPAMSGVSVPTATSAFLRAAIR